MSYEQLLTVSIWQSTDDLSSQTLALMLRAFRANPFKRSTSQNEATDRRVLTALTHANLDSIPLCPRNLNHGCKAEPYMSLQWLYILPLAIRLTC